MATRTYNIRIYLSVIVLLTLPFINDATLISNLIKLRTVTSKSHLDYTLKEQAVQSNSLLFIENIGQFSSEVRFQLHSGDTTIWLAEDAIWITLMEHDSALYPTRIGKLPNLYNKRVEPESSRGVNVKLNFVGANPHPHIETFNRLNAHISYFKGKEPDNWFSDVPVWGCVRYIDLYPGIDLELIGNAVQLQPRLIAHEGADLNAVRLSFEGSDKLELMKGYIRLITTIGKFSFPLLEVVGVPISTIGGPTLIGDQVVTPFHSLGDLPKFTESEQSGTYLSYSTYLGGGYIDLGNDIAVDGTGATYVVGETRSSDFPTISGAFDITPEGISDIFITKLSADGTNLVFSTLIGGSNYETGASVAIDESGMIYVSGSTGSSDFPTTIGSFDPEYNGGYWDGFVAKLNQNGSALIYSTFLGTGNTEGVSAIAVDATGAAFVTGDTESSGFPTTPGAFDSTFNGGYRDAFVTKLNPSGSVLIYSSFLGGSVTDGGVSLAFDNSGNAYIAGVTSSPDFPTTPGAFDTSCRNCSSDNGFVTKLSPSGSALEYSTFLGGDGFDIISGLAIDNSNEVYITGTTGSSNFPTTPGVFDTSFNEGNFDSFVSKLSTDGSNLIYSSFLGGGDKDNGYSIAVDSSGNAYVGGYTSSNNFPVTPWAFDPILTGDADAFVSELNPDGASLVYSTLLGGSGSDCSNEACTLAVSNTDTSSIYITGATQSIDFPTSTFAYDASYNGGIDAFVTKLGLNVARCAGNQWYGTYFGNRDLKGNPTFTQCVDNIDFYWGRSSPSITLPTDNFSIRWTRNLNIANTGWYRFRTFTDDGVRLYIDGVLVIDDWVARPFDERSALTQLDEGPHIIVMEYVEWSDEAMAYLNWYLCPGGLSDCSMNIAAEYQTMYLDIAMPTTCTNLTDQTLAHYGCFVTSIAMALQKLGLNTSPIELNEWLSGEDPVTHRIPRGYSDTCDGSLWPSPATITKFAKEKYSIDLEWKTTGNAIDVIRSKGLPVIMRKNLGDHFSLAVNVIAINGIEALGINDPWHSHVCRVVAENPSSSTPNTKLSCPVSPSVLKHVATKTELDQYSGSSQPLGYYQLLIGTRTPSLQFFIRDAEVLIFNPQGLRTGYDTITGRYLAEVPNSLYYDPSIIPPGDDPTNTFVRTLFIPNDANGTYTLEVTDRSDSMAGLLVNNRKATTFYIDIVGFNEHLESVETTVSGTLQPGLVTQYQIIFNPEEEIEVINNSYWNLFLPILNK